MSLPFPTTPRGFKVYGRVTDDRDTSIAAIESSAIGCPHLHLYTEAYGTFNQPVPHLSVEQAKDLILILQGFVEDAEDPENWRNTAEYKQTWGE